MNDSAEQGQLAAMAAAVDAEAAGGAAGAVQMQQAPAVDPVEKLAGEIAGVISGLVAVLGKALPSLKEIYTEEATAAVGGSVAAVCVKHGWLQGGLLERFGEEVACAFVVLPMGYATVQGVSEDVEHLKLLKLKKEADARQHFENTRSLTPGALSAPAAGATPAAGVVVGPVVPA